MGQEQDSAYPLLDIDFAREGDEVVMAISGELDVSSVPLLLDQMHVLLEAGVMKMTCDIAKLQYIDSTGLSLILMVHKRLHNGGGSLVLLSPAASVRRLFEVTGVQDHLAILPEKVDD